MVYHWQQRPLAFYAHVGFAPVALLLVPFQFWQGLRNRRRGLHRFLGRTYVGAILLAGLGGLAMALKTEAGPVAAFGFGILAVLWIWFTGTAVLHARAKQIALHKEWMIRSAALTLGAVTLRLYLLVLPGLFGFETAYVIVSWLAWVPNLIVAEWVIQRRRAPRHALAAQ